MSMLCSTHYVLTPTACRHYAVLLQYCTIGFLHPHFKNTHQDFSTPIRLAERKLVWQHSFGENQQHWSHTDLIRTYCQSGKLRDGGRKQTDGLLTRTIEQESGTSRKTRYYLHPRYVSFSRYFAQKLAVQSAQNCLLRVRSNTSWIGYLTQPARPPIPRPTQTYDRLYASTPFSPPISHHVTPACDSTAPSITTLTWMSDDTWPDLPRACPRV